MREWGVEKSLLLSYYKPFLLLNILKDYTSFLCRQKSTIKRAQCKLACKLPSVSALCKAPANPTNDFHCKGNLLNPSATSKHQPQGIWAFGIAVDMCEC